MPKKKVHDILNTAQMAGHEAEVRKLKLEKRALQSQLNAAIDARGAIESQLDAACLLKSAPSGKVYVRKKSSSVRSAAIVLPACDWHLGETIRCENVNGVNEYNVNEATKRVNRFLTKAVELVDWYRKLSPVKEIWFPLLGDLISGDIHDELRESNEATAPESAILVQELVDSSIRTLRHETKLPVHIPTIPGNHGRSTQRIRIKTDTRNSWEQMIYRMLAKRWDSDRNVQFHVGESLLNEQVITGRRCRFLHGHVIRYYGGVGGISVPVNKAVQSWNDMRECDHTFFGHYHQFMFHYPRWVACGCTVGASEFSIWVRAPWQHPSQTFVALDPQYGITCAMPIFVTEPKRWKK